LGPIWLVRNGIVVLSDGAYELEIGKHMRHGSPDIAISAATAGHSEKSIWHFDGTRYFLANKSRQLQ